MELKTTLVMLIACIVMTTGVLAAGEFKIQYPAGTDLFAVETVSGNTTITNAIISTLFDATDATVYFADDAIEEADISFATTCAHPNFLYISGNNLVCAGSAYNTTAEMLSGISTGLNESYARLDTENQFAVIQNFTFGLKVNITSCTGTLETNADGLIVCGTDDTGGIPDYTNIAMLNETDQIFTGTQIFDVIEAQNWANASITESQISDLQTYITSTQGNDTFIISVDMNDLAELNSQISGDLISSADMNLSYINLVKGTMSDAQWCLYDSASDSLICNTVPVTDTDTHMGYTNLALTNESEEFDLGLNVSGDFYLKSSGLINCQGKLITDATGNVTCGTDATGTGIQDYTNIAMTNQTSTFTDGFIVDSSNITLKDGASINGTGTSNSYFTIDSGGNMIFVLGA